ncbi:unnamed protein product [Gordionus sp. m RMFG-2023]
MDDVLLTGITPEQYNQRLVFKRIRDKGLRASKGKSVLGLTEVMYLGHQINGMEVKPLEKNLKNITNMNPPNYYHRFVEKFAKVASPLYDLLKKGVHFEWKIEQQEAFKILKEKIGKEPILVCFNNDLEIILAVDASDNGVGGALLHLIDGVERPIIFFSRVFREVETRYSVIEQEYLAVIFGLTKCREYLIGKIFIIYRDHRPLIHLFKKDNKELMLSPRTLVLLVRSFNVEIGYRRRKSKSLLYLKTPECIFSRQQRRKISLQSQDPEKGYATVVTAMATFEVNAPL